MSWTVNVVEDTVKISKAKIKAANTALMNVDSNDYFSYAGEAIDEDGCLIINDDAQEHIDLFGNDEGLLKEFLKFKPKGKLCFSSEEGDNAGDAWGYEFDGKGNVNYLTRVVEWKTTGTESA